MHRRSLFYAQVFCLLEGSNHPLDRHYL
ncbi:hypothetical protein D018_0707A, partial [Vibrio parahaemolyticus VP2007-007]